MERGFCSGLRGKQWLYTDQAVRDKDGVMAAVTIAEIATLSRQMALLIEVVES